MMKFSAEAAKYMTESQIIEYHHDQKLDAPSGTAKKTAEMMLSENPTINQKYSFESLEQKLINFTNFYISSSLGLEIEEVSTQLIKNPTLVLVGSNDLSTPPEQVQSTANLIKNSKFHVIKNSGHLPCVDNPDEFAKIIKNFLL